MTEITVKGERDGLVLTLGPQGDNAEMMEALFTYLEESGSFLRGAKITLDTLSRGINEEELQTIGQMVGGWDITIEAMRTDSAMTREAALSMGIELPFVVSMEATLSGGQNLIAYPDESIEGLLVRRTLRSGQVIRHPGAVTVLGDVNPGAEIMAGGDVVVWGVLRGMVHAGAIGDDAAVVCALKLDPTQLRISGYIAMSPEANGKRRQRFWQRTQQKPELARIQEGIIIVQTWAGAEPQGKQGKGS